MDKLELKLAKLRFHCIVDCLSRSHSVNDVLILMNNTDISGISTSLVETGQTHGQRERRVMIEGSWDKETGRMQETSKTTAKMGEDRLKIDLREAEEEEKWRETGNNRERWEKTTQVAIQRVK